MLESEILTLLAHEVGSATLGMVLFLAGNMVVFRWDVVRGQTGSRFKESRCGEGRLKKE